MVDATSRRFHDLASLPTLLDNGGAWRVVWYVSMYCTVMLAWGLSALLTPNALILHTACGLAISRNYKASELSGDGALAHCRGAGEVTDITTVGTS